MEAAEELLFKKEVREKTESICTSKVE
jgi:hypothetical protein